MVSISRFQYKLKKTHIESIFQRRFFFRRLLFLTSRLNSFGGWFLISCEEREFPMKKKHALERRVNSSSIQKE